MCDGFGCCTERGVGRRHREAKCRECCDGRVGCGAPMPQTPMATTTSGSKVHECGSRAPGTRRAIEAHGFRRSHGSGIFAANSDTEVAVVSNGEFDGDDNSPVMVKAIQIEAEWAAGVIVVVGRRRSGAEWAAGVIVVVGRRGSGVGVIIWVTIRVSVGWGERRQGSFPDPGSL